MIMDYKEKVIALLKSQELSKEQKEKLENIFPELKESEDERIRKELIDYHRSMAAQADDYVHEAWIAWLEKQGEQKPVVIIPKFRIGDNIKTTNEEPLTITKIDGKGYWSEDLFICGFDDSAKWELVERKPTDKVEPKFKVGDWICNDMCIIHITSIENGMYYFDEGDGLPVEFIDNRYHLWTIQDAMDGDVLAFYGEYKGNKMLQVGIIERYVGKHGGCSNTFKIYVGVNWESNLQIGEYMGCSDIRPATKEQRDTLMKAMADAGYTFDFEKKKLKKSEQKQVIDYPNNLPKDNWELIHEFVEKLGRIPKEKDELDLLVEYVLKRRKSTLSEDDKDFMYDTLSNLTELKDRYGEGYGNVGKCIDWLKSLKKE